MNSVFRWYAKLILMLLWSSLVLAVNEEKVEKPKELLRHQQMHRPLFIDRRLKQDTKTPLFRLSAADTEFNQYQQQEVAEIPNPEIEIAEAKATIEKLQIRHSRSRIRFGKGKSTNGPTTLMVPTSNDIFFKVSEDSEEFDNEDVSFEESPINETSNLDQNTQDSIVENITSSSLMNSRQNPSRKYAHIVAEVHEMQRADNLRTLRTVTNVKRQELEGGVTSRWDQNVTKQNIYGVMIRGPVEKTIFEDVLDKSSTQDYITYEDEQLKSLNDSRSVDNVDDHESNIEDDDKRKMENKPSVKVDNLTRFLRIIENQHLLGENCTAGTDLNLGEGVVDRYAQERFRLEAIFAVNRANMLTRLWKYAPEVMLSSEYLLHAGVLSMVEFDEDIFAAGNCYDKLQYRDRWLYCPFAHRLPGQDGILIKDLAVEYKYLSNSSEWFFIARKNAERVITNNDQFSRGYHTYTGNDSAHTERIDDEILTVRYEDGRWSKPYYDCGGGNIWMLTYTVPFFGYTNGTYFFKGTSGIDIDLRRVDIDQCPLPTGSTQLNIFAASDKCKKRTTECIAIPGLGFRRGSYRCVCQRGFYYPDTKSTERYYNGTVIEEEFEKLMLGEDSQYALDGIFECLPCAEGCESCEDGSPCVVSLNWLMRTALLILECCVIACLPAVILFTWKFGNVKVVKAASPVLLRVIVLGAFFIYCTTIVMYPRPNVVTCTVRVWLREIGFSLTYGALMLKTWRISVIFRVRSAKAVKITDMNLLKRLGIIVTIFSVFLGIRTIVAPPVVIVARTADDLKAYLCQTNWWDHSFTTLEVMFLVWGIRLCIVVRKAPSEFNESRFISMAIYNEFLLSVFLNVSMLFLQSPANPDLLYIIFFCHTQLTVTLLLCFIFGSKAYVVFRGGGKEDAIGKLPGATGKFIGKTCRTQATSNQTNSISLQQANFTEEGDGVTEEFRRLCVQLESLKEKNMRQGNRTLAVKIFAMQVAANRTEANTATIQAISSTLKLNDLDSATMDELEMILKGENESCIDPCPEADSRINGKMKKKRNHEKNGSEDSDKLYRAKKVSGGKNCDELASTSTKIIPASIEDKAVESLSKGNGSQRHDGISIADVIENVADHHEVSVETISADTKEHEKSKSGHARTHAIVINLDDKSRFSEEVTV